MDWALVLGAFVVGVSVGLTGMGGGALMTPMLVLFFGVPPLAAVSSDLVASAIMRPVGAVVHFRKGTVRMDLVAWLCVGSVPAAFGGVMVARAMGSESGVEAVIQDALGAALVFSALALFVRSYQRLAERARHRDGSRDEETDVPAPVVMRPIPTVIVGVVGGVVVGLTSVGAGSLIIIALMWLYPKLHERELVGTGLALAVPLSVSAALGHLLFGDLHVSVTTALIVGSIPGTYLGAQLSTRLPGALVRRALAFVLLASALKLLGVSSLLTVVLLVASAALAGPIWMLLRRRHGFPAWPRNELRQRQTEPAG